MFPQIYRTEPATTATTVMGEPFPCWRSTGFPAMGIPVPKIVMADAERARLKKRDTVRRVLGPKRARWQ